MSTFSDIAFLFGCILALYGMVQAVRKIHLQAGLTLVIGGVLVAEWSANHILTAPLPIAWPGLFLLTLLPISCMLMGAIELWSASSRED